MNTLRHYTMNTQKEERKITQYLVAEGSCLDSLSESVEYYIKEGFQPLGGVSADSEHDEHCSYRNWYIQGMVKYE